MQRATERLEVIHTAQAPRGSTALEFERVADGMPQLICVFSATGEYRFLNAAMRAFSGLSLPLRVGTRMREMVHPSDLLRLDPPWRQAQVSGEIFQVDVRLRGGDAHYRWFAMTTIPLRGEDGQVESWCTSATDVHERRSVTDDLHQVLDAFPGLIALWDREQGNRYANRAHLSMYGVTPEELRGRSLASLLGAEAHAALRGRVDDALAGSAQLVHRQITDQRRQVHQLETSLIPLMRDDELQGLLLVDRDVTETALAVAQLSEAEERFELAFEQSPIGIALLGLDGRFLRVNQAMARSFACTLADLRDRSLSDLLHPDEVDDSLALRGQLLRGELTHVEHERICRRFDGELIETRIFKSLVRERGGEPRYFVVQIEDISDRKRAARELERANADLQRSNADLERFAYVASHDLQEPLRTVSSYTRLLADRYRQQLDDTARRYIDYAVDAALRMQQLIAGLLELSRLGRVDGPPQRVSLGQLVSAATALLAEAIATRHAHVEVDPLPELSGYPEHLLRLLQNLLGNALKFVDKNQAPVVKIGASRDGNGWCLTVRDNGVGIAAEYRERVFGMFQRLHTRDQYPGSGIGLAVVQRIVELHRGRVWIADVEGPGTEVRVWLPD
jgi:PAS domain S-box-containing protein